MRELIPFSKEIVFKTNIASITSISLEHEEKVFDGEITGDFIIFGDYKVHNDTTEKELFKYRLPFTALIPDDINKDSVVLNVEEFTYDQIEDDVIRINIEFTIQGEKIEVLEVEETDVTRNDEIEEEQFINDDYFEEEVNLDNEIDNILSVPLVEEEKRDDEMILENEVVEEVLSDDNENTVILETEVKSQEKEKVEEYVTYHVHVVKENETIENILKIYNVSLDYIKEYNEITELKIGDKIIIPEYLDE